MIEVGSCADAAPPKALKIRAIAAGRHVLVARRKRRGSVIAIPELPLVALRAVDRHLGEASEPKRPALTWFRP